jgi:hypothetical protein
MNIDADLGAAAWRTSSYSGNGQTCVEIAFLGDGNIAMRDSKDRGGSVLVFTPAEWDAFVNGVHAGEFAHPD